MRRRMSLRLAAYCWAAAASWRARARAWPAVVPASNSSQVKASPTDQSQPLLVLRGSTVDPQHPPPPSVMLSRLAWEALPPAVAN
ncbi:MAG: hypothetical protein ACKO50_02355, partial [Cyanobium sp.]